jgi:hypothetical protein
MAEGVLRNLDEKYEVFRFGINPAPVSSLAIWLMVEIEMVVCGVIEVMSAILLQVQLHRHNIWAIVLVAFSLVSFVGLGG